MSVTTTRDDLIISANEAVATKHVENIQESYTLKQAIKAVLPHADACLSRSLYHIIRPKWKHLSCNSSNTMSGELAIKHVKDLIQWAIVHMNSYIMVSLPHNEAFETCKNIPDADVSDTESDT